MGWRPSWPGEEREGRGRAGDGGRAALGRLGARSRELGLAGEAAVGEDLAGSLMGERTKSEGRSWQGGCLEGSGRRTPFSGR